MSLPPPPPHTHTEDVWYTALEFPMDAGEVLGTQRVCLDDGLVLPGYDYCLKCSHTFNLLDARGAISVTQRTAYIARIRDLARRAAEAYCKQREEMGYPMLRKAGA